MYDEAAGESEYSITPMKESFASLQVLQSVSGFGCTGVLFRMSSHQLWWVV